jgi:PAS domain-containing protein
MGANEDKIKKVANLRRMAEAEVHRSQRAIHEAWAAMSPEQVMRVLYELSVHQVELERQNEELRRAESEREASLARYTDLYDSAPVGYCTLADGVISEANLAAANLLGVDRKALTTRPWKYPMKGVEWPQTSWPGSLSPSSRRNSRVAGWARPR